MLCLCQKCQKCQEYQKALSEIKALVDKYGVVVNTAVQRTVRRVVDIPGDIVFTLVEKPFNPKLHILKLRRIFVVDNKGD